MLRRGPCPRVDEREGGRRRGVARRAACVVLISLSVGACADDEPIDDPDGVGGDGGGAGADHATGDAAAGGGITDATGSSGSSPGGAGEGGDATPEGGTLPGQIDDEMPAVAGETGIFEGATAAHNSVRSALGLPPLSWSSELATVAQDWADTLAESCGSIGHRPDGAYGENIAARGSRPFVEAFSAEAAVQGWVDEAACWSYGTISGSRGAGTESCDARCVSDLHSSGCGHYTQVVWRDTESVGCGYATCESEGATFELWVCNYDPPGNFIGQAPY